VRRAEADAGEAALVLASRGDRSAEAAVVHAAAAAPPEARAAALKALGRLAARPAVERLVELLAGDDQELADAAGRALAGARGAVPAVTPLLDTADPLLRSRAVRVLGLSGDPAAIEVLLSAHARGDADQRREAAAGLVRLGYGQARG